MFPFKLFLLLRRNMNSCCTDARLIWSFDTRLCTEGKLKCHSISFHPSEVFRETKYCPPPSLFPSLCLLLDLPPSLPPCLHPSVFLLLLRRVCVCIFHYISVIISHPAGRNLLPKTILRQRTLRTVPACNSVWLSLVGILSNLMHVGNKMDYQMWSKMLI